MYNILPEDAIGWNLIVD